MDIKGCGNYGMNILKKHNVESFDDFIELLYNNRNNIRKLGEIVWETQVYFIQDKNKKIIVNELIKIEDLNYKIEKIKKRFNITIPNPQIKINVTNSGDYRKYYTLRTKKLVDIIYKEDIELTKYEF